MGLLLEPVGIFVVFMIVFMIIACIWKALVGTVNLFFPSPEPPQVDTREPTRAEGWANELRDRLGGYGIKVWKWEWDPAQPYIKMLEVPRAPEDPLYEWYKTETRFVRSKECEYRRFDKAFSVEVSGENALAVYVGEKRKKYEFFWCGENTWRCEFMFRDPSWLKAVMSTAWITTDLREGSNTYAIPTENCMAAFLVDLPQDIQDKRFQKPDKLLRAEMQIAEPKELDDGYGEDAPDLYPAPQPLPTQRE